MQNRYVGDIGDYIKYGLLRELAKGLRLGVAWYLFPDEAHNDDGKHTTYLKNPHSWEHYGSELFCALNALVHTGGRHTKSVEGASFLPQTEFANELLEHQATSYPARARWRREWFERTFEKLAPCDLVFADPDNGLCSDESFKPGNRQNWKRMPLSEACTLAEDRQVIVYHHNTRFPGGHEQEIAHWFSKLPKNSLALYWRRYSCRTFFLLNPSEEMRQRACACSRKWGPHLSLYPREGL